MQRKSLNYANLSMGRGRPGKGTIELYHLAKDPFETKNLAKANSREVAELRPLINAEWAAK